MEGSPPSVRCFVGIRPTGVAVQAFEALRDRLQREGGEVVKWHPPEKWHVTLAFLGQQDVALLPVFEASVAAACASAMPFDLHARGLNLWPSASRARVVSLGIGGDLCALKSLQRDVAARLSPFLPESGKGEEFQPHLTLGYVRRGRVLADGMRQALQTLTTGPFPAWRVQTVDLMQGGAEYRTLACCAIEEPAT